MRNLQPLCWVLSRKNKCEVSDCKLEEELYVQQPDTWN